MKRIHGWQAVHHAFRQLPPRDLGSLTVRVQCVQISSQTKQRKSIHDGGTNDLEHDCFSRPSRGKERQSPPFTLVNYPAAWVSHRLRSKIETGEMVTQVFHFRAMIEAKSLHLAGIRPAYRRPRDNSNGCK